MTFTLFQLSSPCPDLRSDLQARNTTSTNSKLSSSFWDTRSPGPGASWFHGSIAFQAVGILKGLLSDLTQSSRLGSCISTSSGGPAGDLHRRSSSGLFKVWYEILGFLAKKNQMTGPAVQASVRPRRAKKTASFQGTLGRWLPSTLCVCCWLDLHMSKQKSLWQNAIYAWLYSILRNNTFVTAGIHKDVQQR